RLQTLSLSLQQLLFVVQLDAVELGQLSKAQVDDVLGLALGEPEFFPQLLPGFRLVLARADQLDDLVDLRVGLQPAFYDVQSLLAPVGAEPPATTPGCDSA